MRLKILTDTQHAPKIRVNQGGQINTLLRYRVSVVELVKGQFDAKYIYSGFGGGDCGIRFRQGDVYVFSFNASAFLRNQELGHCDLIGTR